VSAVGDGSRIDVKVYVLWPLPLVFLCWVAAYAIGLRHRSFGSDDIGTLTIALLFWGTCAYLVVAVVRGCIQEVRRLTMAQPEPAGDPG
jgi:hypothetical protein